MKNNTPLVAALAVVMNEGKILLVRRRKEPDADLWGFPGGHVELGETIPACAVRELVEETGVRATAGELITTIEVIRKDDAGNNRFHFLLVAVKCHYQSGEPQAADDVAQAKWFDLAEISEGTVPMSKHVDTVALLAAQATGGRDGYFLDSD